MPAASGKDRVTVFLIHGMGKTDKCFYHSSAEMLARDGTIASCPVEANEVEDTETIPIHLPGEYLYRWPYGANGGQDISLKSFGTVYKTTIPHDATSGQPEIVQYAYYWHADAWPIQLQAIGCDLPEGEKSDRPPARCSSDAANRVLVNGLIKRIILNEGLSDATLYSGGFGEIIRAGTREAMCFVVL
ncbi:MAG: hypothetical protein AAGJ50_07325, partial [Pseudomonadota bacterium]